MGYDTNNNTMTIEGTNYNKEDICLVEANDDKFSPKSPKGKNIIDNIWKGDGTFYLDYFYQSQKDHVTMEFQDQDSSIDYALTFYIGS